MTRAQAASVDTSDLAPLPPDWRYEPVSALGQPDEQAVLTGPFGTNLGRSDFVERGVPVLTIGCLTEGGINLDKALYVSEDKARELERYQLREGDLLFSRMASVGRAGLVPKSLAGALFNYHIMRLRLDESRIDPRIFINYVRGAKQVRDYLKAVNHGATRDGINTEQLLGLPVAVPPPAEQREIVAEIEKQFSRLDEAVANLRRVKANLKRQTVAILSAAISGELLGRASLQADTDRPEFAPAIDLPSGWSWISAAEVCEIVASGSTPKPEEMTSGAGEVPFIKVYNLGFDGSLDFTVKPTFIRRAIHGGQLARSRCLPGDVLMNIVGPPLGKVSLVPDSYPEWNINQAIVTFRVGPHIMNRLLAYWLMARPVQRRIERTSKATAGQFNVQVSTCRKLVLPLPPLDEQARIVAEVDRRLSIVREVEAEVDANSRRAEALRQAVLTQAFVAQP